MSAIVLLYHRISPPNVDPWDICVSPEHFSEHMEVLRRIARPCTLTELVHAHAANDIPEDAVAVTFDDGYLDNLTKAKPILEKFDVPATVFVCSGGVGRGEEFWWDDLERAFFNTNAKSLESLVLRVAGTSLSWSLGDGDEGKTNSGSPDAALSNYMAVWEALRPLPPQAQAQAMRQIRAWANLSSEARATYRILSPGEVAGLADGDLVSIGAHTISHPLLPAHPHSFQRSEIVGSRNFLEDLLGHPVKHFAYPFGKYDETALEILRESSFTCACNSEARNVSSSTQIYEIPRLPVKNWNGDQFLRAILERKNEVHSISLAIGQVLRFSLGAFKSQTGDLRRNVIECRPEKHGPGHCLFGSDFTLLNTGSYRAVVVLEQSGSRGDSVIDVFENRLTGRTLAELEPDTSSHQSAASLEFFAREGYTVEVRVFWRGQDHLKIKEVRMERMS